MIHHRRGQALGRARLTRAAGLPAIRAPHAACVRTRRGLDLPVGLLRRISDTPTGHRFPPQRLTTLIKRPS